MGGLHDIFDVLHKFRPEEQGETLALHSSPLLAHFEKIINSLTERLRNYERELSSWIFKKAEESRYSALGEIAGLVVHDLSAPLHVMNFCTKQLVDEPEKIFDPKYRMQLVNSGERAMELITALKTYLRSPGSQTQSVVFSEAHPYIIKMLSTQFHDRGFNRVKFVVDPRVIPLNFGMARPDFIHVLLNLHVNSLENLLGSKEKLPEIRVELGSEMEQSSVDILISDNGTGLSAERFEEMTSFVFQDSRPVAGSNGGSMGLRLVRRLVERYGGSLTVDPTPQNGKGTTFRLRVKLAVLTGKEIEIVDLTEREQDIKDG